MAKYYFEVLRNNIPFYKLIKTTRQISLILNKKTTNLYLRQPAIYETLQASRKKDNDTMTIKRVLFNLIGILKKWIKFVK